MSCSVCTVASPVVGLFVFFFFNDTATTEIYTLSLHDALPILFPWPSKEDFKRAFLTLDLRDRSEEHTSELQSLAYLVCRLLLEKKKNTITTRDTSARGRVSCLYCGLCHVT